MPQVFLAREVNVSDTDPPTTEAADNRITPADAVEQARAHLVRWMDRLDVDRINAYAHALDVLARTTQASGSLAQAFIAGWNAFDALPNGANIPAGLHVALAEYLAR